jgi:hypothetical protein
MAMLEPELLALKSKWVTPPPKLPNGLYVLTPLGWRVIWQYLRENKKEELG